MTPHSQAKLPRHGCPEQGTMFNLGFNGGVLSGIHLDIGIPLYLDAHAQAVPEPAQVWLFTLGGSVLLAWRRRPAGRTV